MPVFSGHFDWVDGLTWPVTFLDANTALSPTAPVHDCIALVDTGASTTCIDKSVATELQLPPLGKTPMATAGGEVATNNYLVHVALRVPVAPNKEGIEPNQWPLFRNIHVSEVDLAGTAYRALIGCDLLRIGVLTIAHDGHYTFAW